MRHRSQKGDTNEVDEVEIGKRAGKKTGLGGDRVQEEDMRDKDGWMGGHKATTVLESLEMSSYSLRVDAAESTCTVLESYCVLWICILYFVYVLYL